MDTFKIYENLINQNILLSFKGKMSQEILVEMGKFVKQNVSMNNYIKKIFTIFIELSQNIMYYSAERDSGDKNYGIGIIIFSENESKYNILSGNKILKKDTNKITLFLEKINAMTDAELKEFYFERIKNKAPENSRGAGLGFIDIRRKTNSKIEYKIDELNDEMSFISLCVNIKKGEI